MMSRIAIFLFCFACVVSPSGARAQNPDEAQIRAAVRRGVQFLKGRQNRDGTWNYPGHELGITSLAALALLESNVPADDPSIQSALQFVRSAAQHDAQTYDLSLTILLLSRVNDSQDHDLILLLGHRLVAGQLSSGGWTYQCPLVMQLPPSSGSVTNKPRASAESGKRTGRLNAGTATRPGGGDNSNTQFAVLGVWAAGRAGLNVKDTMIEVDHRFRGTQSASGGWGYTGTGDSDAMTCAGLMSLVLAKGHKVLEGKMANRRPDKEQADAAGEKQKMDSDPQIERGIQRVEAYANNIGGSTLYFLWSVERVAVALGMPRIGQVDWYNRGAASLLQTQTPEGGWRSNRGEVADTSFALLFLRRSNLTEGVPQLVSGRAGTGSGDNQMRAGRLEDLKKSVKAPEGSDK